MKIAVYCSAKDCIPAEYLALGEQLGQWLAEQGAELVYGGATGGLMSCTSHSYKQASIRLKKEHNRIWGVIPKCVIAAGRKDNVCDELIEVDRMSERKQRMRDIADVFICLPGSYGTLDEMMDVLSSGIVGEHNKPLYILNHNHFYDSLQALADHMRALRFLPQAEVYKPIFVNTLEELYGFILS